LRQPYTPASVPVETSRGPFSVLVHAPGPKDPALPLVLLVSGEGGWRKFDALLAGWLADAGYWVGGVDAMKYFWNPQDDRRALAADMRGYASVLARSAGRDAAAPFVLVGFSFGAELAPWIAAEGTKDGIRGLVMLGPDETGSLEFRVSEMLGFEAKDHIFSVADALRSAAGIPVVLLHGEKDSHSSAPALAEIAAEPKRLVVAGADHHFSGAEDRLRQGILEGLAWMRSVVPSPAPAGHRP
jgi:type IV secretory pathway VirJ component